MAAENNLIAESYRSEIIRRRSRWFLVFLLLFLGFCVITVININSGNVNIPISRILDILFTRDGDPKEVDIIWTIRLPRILMAAMLGGALSLSGFLLFLPYARARVDGAPLPDTRTYFIKRGLRILPSYWLCYQWGYLRILLLSNNSPNISVVRASFHIGIVRIKSSDSLNIFLPVCLLFAFVMQKPHKSPQITHTKLGSVAFCQRSNATLVFVI